MTEVVAALLRQDGKFLICQRPAHKARGLLWEFPGGKVEPGENMAQALARECREELGVTVAVEEPVAQVVHEYPDLTIRLTLLDSLNKRIQFLETVCRELDHNDQRWITAAELPQYEFSPADRAFLPALGVM